ncbi:hypothetical protein BDZ85DRAFT_269264 [Elsinoe ampelina]|uniref:Uncharacterized protein n=1 Tax=Elsinoe ampelina TaxID=302913 RepID=A0A6A6G0A0_9PEZI|nr:hypothetical protein BDZ85DRAFT_269264 [Elsinoe ampelina]
MHIQIMEDTIGEGKQQTDSAPLLHLSPTPPMTSTVATILLPDTSPMQHKSKTSKAAPHKDTHPLRSQSPQPQHTQ